MMKILKLGLFLLILLGSIKGSMNAVITTGVSDPNFSAMDVTLPGAGGATPVTEPEHPHDGNAPTIPPKTFIPKTSKPVTLPPNDITTLNPTDGSPQGTTESTTVADEGGSSNAGVIVGALIGVLLAIGGGVYVFKKIRKGKGKGKGKEAKTKDKKEDTKGGPKQGAQ